LVASTERVEGMSRGGSVLAKKKKGFENAQATKKEEEKKKKKKGKRNVRRAPPKWGKGTNSEKSRASDAATIFRERRGS